MCIESDQTIHVEDIDEVNTNYVAFTRTSPLTVSFDHPGGSVTGVQVDPAGPTIIAATNSVVFGTSDLNNDYTITVTYTDPPSSRSNPDGGPLETPVKKPIFRPVNTCP